MKTLKKREKKIKKKNMVCTYKMTNVSPTI